jgi:hypothetical protein
MAFMSQMDEHLHREEVKKRCFSYIEFIESEITSLLLDLVEHSRWFDGFKCIASFGILLILNSLLIFYLPTKLKYVYKMTKQC